MDTVTAIPRCPICGEILRQGSCEYSIQEWVCPNDGFIRCVPNADIRTIELRISKLELTIQKAKSGDTEEEHYLFRDFIMWRFTRVE